MKKFAVAIAVFALLGAMLAYAIVQMQAGEYSPREIPSPLIGKPVPAFALPALTDPGRTVTNDELRGRPYLLNVWASWCVACRDEHPYLVQLAREHGVRIIGLNYKDARDEALAWLQRFEDPYELSIADRSGRFGIELGVYGVPETFLIDRDGVIRYKKIGPIDAETIRSVLLPKLAELNAAPAAARAAP
ncbi:MAG TPA: DsbE family thiol:disulfide interchange protein [Burkholderiales bacterium]